MSDGPYSPVVMRVTRNCWPAANITRSEPGTKPDASRPWSLWISIRTRPVTDAARAWARITSGTVTWSPTRTVAGSTPGSTPA